MAYPPFGPAKVFKNATRSFVESWDFEAGVAIFANAMIEVEQKDSRDLGV